MQKEQNHDPYNWELQQKEKEMRNHCH